MGIHPTSRLGLLKTENYVPMDLQQGRAVTSVLFTPGNWCVVSLESAALE